MRLPRRADKILFTTSIVAIFATVACLTHFFIKRNTFAATDPLESTITESDVTSEKTFHFVNFYDKGEKLIVKTDAGTVGEALKRAGFTINESDTVEPSLDAEITSDNFHINIYRAHPVLLIDGATKLYRSTASYDPATIFNEAGIIVYDGDQINSVPNTDFLESGVAVAYELKRGGGSKITVETEIPFSEKTIVDYTLLAGTSEVRQLGEVGRKNTTYEVLYVNNVEASRTLISEMVISEPVERITAVGGRSTSDTSAQENEKITWDFLKGQGFSDEQTAGIMGNLTQEHHFNTSDTAGGLGIAQWTGGRRSSLLGRSNPYNIYTQLDFLMSELNGSYKSVQSAIRLTTAIEEATRVFQNQFERCGICRENNRISFAYDIYERYAQNEEQ